MGNKSTSFNEISNIKINNKNIDFITPKIMGILNLTPDSFYDGGSLMNTNSMLKHTEEMIQNGVDIIDIGAVSTRPGADIVPADEELRRLIEPIKLISSKFPEIILSIDTYRAEVAEIGIAAGAHIINDISGGTMDANMFNIIAKLKVPYVLMHIHGSPQTMQKVPITHDAISIVKNFFRDSVIKLHKLGVHNIILDPGFGFGKSQECNYTLLKNMEEIRIENLPILAGVSRKSLVNKILNTTPQNALNGTTTLNTIALLSGANILRVHDVKEAKEVIKIIEFMDKVCV